MARPDWTELREAFEAALAQRGPEREAFLADLTRRDPTLGGEVASLLRAHETPHSLFGTRAVAAVRRGGLEAVAHGAPDAAETMRARIEGDLADRYTLTGELGRGGMAVVFSGTEHKHNRPVALKVMRPSITSRIDRRRFGVEIRVTAQLAHPHIVPLYDSGEAGGLPYYVTAAVPGTTLAAHLAAHGALPLPEVRTITRGLAAALTHAHACKILHRDVKPSNVLLHDQIALLTDFGIARALNADDGLTLAGHALGTPRYMSPEQIRGGDVDARADLFALGLVAYEMLTGVTPVSGSTLFEIIAQRLERPIPPPSTYRAELPPSLDAFFTRALAPAPGDRFASATAFREAFEGALDGTAVPAEPKPMASLAVLPFENRTPGGDDAYLADGLTEQLIHQLSAVDDLRVMAHHSSLAFRDPSYAPHDVGAALDVRHLVYGSVQRSGSHLRVTAQLVEAVTDATVWSAQYDRDAATGFVIQDEIANAVVEALVEALGVQIAPPPRSVRPDAHVYDVYLQARHAIFSFTEEGLRRALTLLDRALDLFGDDVTLLSAKGYALWQLVNAGIDPDPAHLEAVLACAARIERLAPASPEAHRLRGLAAMHGGRPEDAVAHLTATLEAEPTDLDAALWLTFLLGFRGQPHRAEPHVAMLLERDPLNPLHQMLPGFLALMRGQTAAAPPAFRAALAAEPSNPVLRLGCGQAEAMAGETDAALATLRSLDDLAPGTLFAGLGRLLRWGLGDAANPLSDADRAAAATDLQWCWTAAQGHALLGDTDEAVRWLHRALDVGFINYPLIALHDPLLRPLRGDAGFEDVLAEMEPRWAASLPLLGTAA